MNTRLTTLLVACLAAATAQAERTETRFDQGWKFALGDASSHQADFGHGTEYFNYLTKAASIHNEGPYALKFDDSAWQDVRLPHDWVTQLPYDPTASHSHGYRTVGYKWPQNSVGWYRKEFTVDASLEGQYVELQFDGIFRDAEVWVNGFYMGREHSGYVTQVYDISDYLNYGGRNLVCVRADASLEEGWFYEGAGIYRNTWLRTTDALHVATHGTFAYTDLCGPNYDRCTMTVETEVQNSSLGPKSVTVGQQLLDAEGQVVAECKGDLTLLAKQTLPLKQTMAVSHPQLWDTERPYLYTLRTQVRDAKGQVLDEYLTTTGIREVRFEAETGFWLNGRNVKLHGVNMHQDMAGVGSAIPDALQDYIVERLKSLGCNAYRASHNPMTPAMLDACDRAGLLVIDENRLSGVNREHLDLLGRMIRRDRNHPCVILWSDGNEEWGLENTIQGTRVAASMREYTHRLDPTRPVTMANAGGTELIKGLEVVGYNYIVQNDVEGRHRQHPEWKIVGTEETTACGTRGIYYDDRKNGHMASMNRTDSTYENIIERGWHFYHDTPWAAGIFYWTGFDYRGEPNPLGFPAVGSEFGILDYCGFEKDEAWYLRSWWTDETVLHIFPHWNLKGHEGEEVSIWAYSNCDEVELTVNGRSLGRKPMPRDGHLTWTATYQPGTVKAVGYRNGRRVATRVLQTTGEATQLSLQPHRQQLQADGRDVSVVRIELQDRKGRFVPDACQQLTLKLDGPGRILGVGNGDPTFKGKEHPAELECKAYDVPSFNGLAMVIVQAADEAGSVTLTVEGEGVKPVTLTIPVVGK